jgi:hypothetical protein
MPSQRPERSEAAEYYFTYIDQVRPGDICNTLRSQRDETRTRLCAIDDARAGHRYVRGRP